MKNYEATTVTITKPWPVEGRGVRDVLLQKNSFSHKKAEQNTLRESEILIFAKDERLRVLMSSSNLQSATCKGN